MAIQIQDLFKPDPQHFRELLMMEYSVEDAAMLAHFPKGTFDAVARARIDRARQAFIDTVNAVLDSTGNAAGGVKATPGNVVQLRPHR